MTQQAASVFMTTSRTVVSCRCDLHRASDSLTPYGVLSYPWLQDIVDLGMSLVAVERPFRRPHADDLLHRTWLVAHEDDLLHRTWLVAEVRG